MDKFSQIAARHAPPLILFAADIALLLQVDCDFASAGLAAGDFGPTLYLNDRLAIRRADFERWLGSCGAGERGEVSQ